MIELSVKAEGMEVMRKQMKTISKLGSTIRAVELHSRPREDGDEENAQILEWLKKSGRDFVTPDSETTKAISEAYVKEFERRGGISTVKKADDPKKKAKEIDAAGFREAMKAYMDKVSERIEQQDAVGGLDDLSPAYKEYKDRVFGFIYPIGKASGQLIDNLNPDGVGARNIRLKTK